MFIFLEFLDWYFGRFWCSFHVAFHSIPSIFGQKDIGASFENRIAYGRTCSIDERNHSGYSGDQNVCVGKAIWTDGGICKKVNKTSFNLKKMSF